MCTNPSNNNISYNYRKANYNMYSNLLNADFDTLEGCTEVNEMFAKFYNELRAS